MRIVTLKQYELSNPARTEKARSGGHLGNVQTTVYDRRTPKEVGGGNHAIKYFEADVIFATDYYPFGSVMSWTKTAGTASGREFSYSQYRFRFNGKEMDAESNYLDYGKRIYNGRLARFLSVDPLTESYPWYSTYQFAGNKPIKFIDLDGCEEYDKGIEWIQARITKPVLRPVNTVVTSGFGPRWGHMHPGIDFDAQFIPIVACSDGFILTNSWLGGYGNAIQIYHGTNRANQSVVTLYGHMSKPSTSLTPGSYVKQGSIIGISGSTGYSTGPHLHLELRLGGNPVYFESNLVEIDKNFRQTNTYEQYATDLSRLDELKCNDQELQSQVTEIKSDISSAKIEIASACDKDAARLALGKLRNACLAAANADSYLEGVKAEANKIVEKYKPQDTAQPTSTKTDGTK